MENEKRKISVTNKSAGLVVYSTSFGRREFHAGQTRHNISAEELEELVQLPGGAQLFYNYLYVDDPSFLQNELEINPEPEYYLKEADIPEWINTCTLEQFKDALDFAPEGTKDLIKKFAVSMPLNDYSKREAIKSQLGLDITSVIENAKSDEEEANASSKTNTRRTTPAPTGRRATVTISVPKK